MKKLLLLALLAAGVGTAAAQTPRTNGRSSSAATRAASTNRDSPANAPTTTYPNASAGNGQRTGKKINTAPATGPTRASRSSSTIKSAKQGGASGSGNIESMSKSGTTSPGVKK